MSIYLCMYDVCMYLYIKKILDNPEIQHRILEANPLLTAMPGT